MLNFGNRSVQFKNCNLKCGAYVELPPNKESIVQVRVPRSQGICMTSNEVSKLGLLVARTIVTVPRNHVSCFKVCNATTSCVVLKKGELLAKMSPLDDSCHVILL